MRSVHIMWMAVILFLTVCRWCVRTAGIARCCLIICGWKVLWIDAASPIIQKITNVLNDELDGHCKHKSNQIFSHFFFSFHFRNSKAKRTHCIWLLWIRLLATIIEAKSYTAKNQSVFRKDTCNLCSWSACDRPLAKWICSSWMTFAGFSLINLNQLSWASKVLTGKNSAFEMFVRDGQLLLDVLLRATVKSISWFQQLNSIALELFISVSFVHINSTQKWNYWRSKKEHKEIRLKRSSLAPLE